MADSISSFDPENLAKTINTLVHFAEIGRVAAAWATFEVLVDFASIELAEIADARVGICFTAQIAGIGRKLDAYIALARFRKLSSKLISDLNAFAQEATGLSEKRNRIVHDLWMFDLPDTKGFERVEISARKLSKIHRHPMDAAKIEAFAKEIISFANGFTDLHKQVKIYATLPAPT